MTLAEYIREEGREEGLLIGQIMNCREILGMPITTLEELNRLSREELQRALGELKAQVSERLKP